MDSFRLMRRSSILHPLRTSFHLEPFKKCVPPSSTKQWELARTHPYTPGRGEAMGAKGPDLAKYMDKRLRMKLNGGRKVEGILRGYDHFMNVVLNEVKEEESGAELGNVVIRGNAIVIMEAQEPISQ